MIRYLILTMTVCGVLVAEAQEAKLVNGVLQAVFYLPDAKDGYYRGARFDWSGVVKQRFCNP